MYVELTTSTSLKPDLCFCIVVWKQRVGTLRHSRTEASPSISTNSVAVLQSVRHTNDPGASQKHRFTLLHSRFMPRGADGVGGISGYCAPP